MKILSNLICEREHGEDIKRSWDDLCEAQVQFDNKDWGLLHELQV